MGYRRLIKKYMQHLYDCTGDPWIAGKSCTNLSDRDLDELRSIWLDVERDVETDAQGNLNLRALALCKEHCLTIDELAKRLGWQRRIIEEWLLPAEHPRYRQMTRRDFRHFETSIGPVLNRLDDRN